MPKLLFLEERNWNNPLSKLVGCQVQKKSNLPYCDVVRQRCILFYVTSLYASERGELWINERSTVVHTRAREPVLEDGIRDRSLLLEFRRVLFRSDNIGPLIALTMVVIMIPPLA